MNKEILEITKEFHDTYEKLASEYTYETREDTRVFDINSNNGKLMYATVNEIVSPILEENQELKKQLEDANEKIILLQASESMLEWKKELEKNQQKEFIKYLKEEINNTTSRKEQLRNKKAILVLDTRNRNYNTILQKYKEIIGDDK